MSDKFALRDSAEYRDWVVEVKTRLRSLQVKAAVSVNSALLEFYWALGADIVKRQKDSAWGSGFLEQLSQDLRVEFPDMKGFSRRNLERMRQWYLFYADADEIATQPVSQLSQIPWSHNIAIVSKCQSVAEALYYVQNTIDYGWSRNVLTHQLESKLWEREGKAISNFSTTLPSPQSDLAQQALKDPYVFDFLSLTKGYNERELEQGLVEHVTQFLLELGAGFAYVGRQVLLQVGDQDFFVDLLFYHTHLHCYVVIELKAGDFKPEYVGKLNFYLNAVNGLIRRPEDAKTIGLLLCKKRNGLVAEWALANVNQPIGVSEYEIMRELPDEVKGSLPSIEEIEAAFGDDEG
ncbi:MAG: PDDEXK nuclease domain-containing protein [Cyanobacteria bacterium J06634_5]